MKMESARRNDGVGNCVLEGTSRRGSSFEDEVEFERRLLPSRPGIGRKN